jgi:hypothetical protein
MHVIGENDRFLVKKAFRCKLYVAGQLLGTGIMSPSTVSTLSIGLPLKILEFHIYKLIAGFVDAITAGGGGQIPILSAKPLAQQEIYLSGSMEFFGLALDRPPASCCI